MTSLWKPSIVVLLPHKWYFVEQQTANSKSFKIAQNTTSEPKGRQFTKGKVTQRLFSFDKYTYLAIYRKFPPEWSHKIYITTVGEFSLVCCTSMAHAGNTKIWEKIISAYAKKCSITEFSSLRREGGGGKKRNYICPLAAWTHRKRSDQWSWCWHSFKILRSIPRGNARVSRGKTC